MPDTPDNQTKQNLLDVAEALFSSRGYAAVKLRDIANALEMKHASLYYYVPGGKKQLFLEVIHHSFERHQRGISEVIDQADDNLVDRLYAISDWFVSQPAMDIARMQQGDRPKLSDTELQDLIKIGFDALRLPIVGVLEEAGDRQEIVVKDLDLTAMALISMTQSASQIPNLSVQQRSAIGRQLVDMMLEGLRPR